MELLYAAPYELRGVPHAGKVHAIKEDDRTYCGTTLRYTNGSIRSGNRGTVSCKGCMRSLDSADSQEEARQEWEQRQTELAKQRQEKNDEWWTWYKQYLLSGEWEQRRKKVLTRSDGVCEGCRDRPALHVHHLTYAHAGNELLFELVALCRPCHQVAHPDKVI